MTDHHAYKLSDRPKWWLPRLFKVLAILMLIFGFSSWAISTFLYIDVMALSGEETVRELAAGFFDEMSSFSLEALFSVAFLWLIALAVDKLDELVWLAANDEDRKEIIQKRKKKNAKNN